MAHPYSTYKIISDFSSEVPANFNVNKLDEAKQLYLDKIGKRNRLLIPKSLYKKLIDKSLA